MKIEYDIINNKKIIRKKKINFDIELDNGSGISYVLPEIVSEDIWDRICEFAANNNFENATIKNVEFECLVETEPIEQKIYKPQ